MTLLTAETLARAVGCGAGTARTWLPYLTAAMTAFGIDGKNRVAHFLAQIGHESTGLSTTVESLNYSHAERIVAVFRKFDLDKDRVVDPEELALARRYVSKPADLAEFAYGGRMGNTVPGDGFKFRGRGLIQVTGRTNYEAIRDLLREQGLRDVPDLLVMPGALAEPKWAAMSTACYWHEHGCNELADAGDLRKITKAINGGTNGLEDRLARFARAQKALS